MTRLLILLFVATLLSPSDAWAGKYIKDGAEVPAPQAATLFCEQHPAECSASEVRMMPKLTRKDRVQLELVMKHVRQYITYQGDPEGQDIWDLIKLTGSDADRPGKGGCEESMNAAAYLLKVRWGWPSSALRRMLVKTPDDEGHYVLSIETRGGTIVLDFNHMVRIHPIGNWEGYLAEGYRFVSRQSADLKTWVSTTENNKI